MPVAILFDDEQMIVFGNEVGDLVVERESPHPQGVEMHALLFKGIERFLHRRAGRAVIDDTHARGLHRLAQYRCGQQIPGVLEFAQQALHVIHVVRTGLAVAGIAVLGGAAGKERTARRVSAGIGAIGDAVTFHVQIASEVYSGFEIVEIHDLAAVVALRIVPGERLAQVIVHADVQIQHHEDRGLEPFRVVERTSGEFETFARVFRKQQHLLGIAMRCIGAGQYIRLLGTRWHAGGRSAALHIKNHRRYFGKIRQPDEFLHQRYAGAGSTGKRAGAIPSCTDHHAD